MRGTNSRELIPFDLEIKRTTRKNKRCTKKQKQLTKQKESISVLSTTPITENMADETVNGPCASSPRRLARLTNNPATRRTEMKIGLLQIIYANPFTGLDHEYPYTHLTKFYELVGMLGAPEVEEEADFMRLFPHSLIGKAED